MLLASTQQHMSATATATGRGGADEMAPVVPPLTQERVDELFGYSFLTEHQVLQSGGR
jgi:hypothetical protein